MADGHWPRPTDAQQDGDRLVRIKTDGTFVAEYGKLGAAPGEFMGPHALAFDSQGRLFVADRSNNRVQVFDRNMQFVDEWRQFGRPSGIAILRDDTLIVADSEIEPVHWRPARGARGRRQQDPQPRVGQRLPRRQREGRLVALLPAGHAARGHGRGQRRQRVRRADRQLRSEPVRRLPAEVGEEMNRIALGVIGAPAHAVGRRHLHAGRPAANARDRHHRRRRADGDHGAHRRRRSADEGRGHGQVQRQRRRPAPRQDEARRAGGRDQPHAGDRGVLRRVGLGDAAHRRDRGRRQAASSRRRDRQGGGGSQQPGHVPPGRADRARSGPATSSSSRPACITASPTWPITSSTCRSGRIRITCCPPGYVHPLLKK